MHHELGRTLGVLAAPWEEQRRHLEGVFGDRVAVDEIGLEFGDIAPVALAQGRQAGLSDEALCAVQALVDQLDAMSGLAESRLWTVEGLRDSSEWAQVRTLAHAARSLVRSGADRLVGQP